MTRSARFSLHLHTALQIVDLSARIYREHIGVLLRALGKSIGAIALFFLLLNLRPHQPIDWSALSPLRAESLISMATAAASGMAWNDLIDTYAVPIIYTLLACVIAAGAIFGVFTRTFAAATHQTAPSFSISMVPAALFVLPMLILSTLCATALRDLALVGYYLLQEGSQTSLIATILELLFNLPSVLLGTLLALFAAPFLLAAPVSTIEGKPFVASVRRSLQLLHGSFAQVYWMTLILSMISAIILTLPDLAFVVVLEPLGYIPRSISSGVANFSYQLIEVLLLPFYLIAISLLFVSRRRTFEGADLEARLHAIENSV